MKRLAEKTIARLAMLCLVGIGAAAMLAHPLALASYGVLALAGVVVTRRWLCSYCPHRRDYDCLFLPARWCNAGFVGLRIKEGRPRPVGRLLPHLAMAAVILYPQAYLWGQWWLFGVFWAFVVLITVGFYAYYCSRCRNVACVLNRWPTLGNVNEAIEELSKAGLDAWDNVEEPGQFIQELR